MFAQTFHIYYMIFLAFIFHFKTKRKGTQNVVSICMLIVLVCIHKICPVLGIILMYKRKLFIKIGREEDFSLIFISIKIGVKETSLN